MEHIAVRSFKIGRNECTDSANSARLEKSIRYSEKIVKEFAYLIIKLGVDAREDNMDYNTFMSALKECFKSWGWRALAKKFDSNGLFAPLGGKINHMAVKRAFMRVEDRFTHLLIEALNDGYRDETSRYIAELAYKVYYDK